MVSNKTLGDYIEILNRRNSDLKYNENDVRGISNTKQIMDTKARMGYTDLSNFYVIKPNEFIFNPRTSRNGERIGVVFNNTQETYIFSFNNIAFRIKETAKHFLFAPYLYLFFNKPEFDRYARYNSWGSATELFNWADMCETEVNLPNIEEQKKIVNEYNTIQNRIKLLEQINLLFLNLSKIIVEKYLSNEYKELGEIITIYDSKRKPLSSEKRSNMRKIYPYYGAATLMDYVENYIFDGIYGLIAEDGSVMDNEGNPILQYVCGKFWVNNHAHIFQGNNNFSTELIYILLGNTDIREYITGAVQLKINQENLKSIKIKVPKEEYLENLNIQLKSIFNCMQKYTDELLNLRKMLNLLLVKIS